MRKPRSVKDRDWPIYQAGVKEGRFQMRMEVLSWFQPFFMDYTNDRDGELYKAIKFILQRLSAHLKLAEDKIKDEELQRKIAQDEVTPPTPDEVSTALKRFRDSESE